MKCKRRKNSATAKLKLYMMLYDAKRHLQMNDIFCLTVIFKMAVIKLPVYRIFLEFSKEYPHDPTFYHFNASKLTKLFINKLIPYLINFLFKWMRV